MTPCRRRCSSTRNSRASPRKLIVTANRNGFLYILDRTNGKFLFAKQFAQQLNWAKGIDENGRPISAGLIPDENGVKVCPANGGATNWYSPSYNPATHMFYFRSLEDCAVFRAQPTPFEPGAGYYATGARVSDEPGTAYINAFDLDKLDFAWRDQQIGRYKGWGGVMSTATGLVAYGDDAREFRHSRRPHRQAPLALQRRPTHPCLAHELRRAWQAVFRRRRGQRHLRLRPALSPAGLPPNNTL